MRRGFKARAEELASDARVALGLQDGDRLDPWRHAERLGVVVMALDDMPLAARHRDQLTLIDPDSWSGMTLEEAGLQLIVLNPIHAKTRQCSTLMHELSHIQLKHVPARVDVSASGLMLLSEYDEAQEAEADWLAGALLLPRSALIRERGRGRSPADIASLFGVSLDLCQWRLRMTGVEAQLARRGVAVLGKDDWA